MTDTANAPERIVEIINYVLQDQEHNRLVPRVIDIAYTAFVSARLPHEEDGGPRDWFTDTRPTVIEMIEAIAKEVAPLSQAISTHRDELVAAADEEAFARGANWAQEKARVEGRLVIVDSPELATLRADLAEAQAKIARLTEALDEKQDGGKSFWMKWTQKRLEINRAMFLRDAKLALAGDVRALRNRVELMEAEPVPLVLSAALQENANE